MVTVVVVVVAGAIVSSAGAVDGAALVEAALASDGGVNSPEGWTGGGGALWGVVCPPAAESCALKPSGVTSNRAQINRELFTK